MKNTGQTIFYLMKSIREPKINSTSRINPNLRKDSYLIKNFNSLKKQTLFICFPIRLTASVPTIISGQYQALGLRQDRLWVVRKSGPCAGYFRQKSQNIFDFN